jgi:hypothetical protein
LLHAVKPTVIAITNPIVSIGTNLFIFFIGIFISGSSCS